ncbi:hypothetical protein HYH02_006612 [Chlamydomonas schloesseri]|uniref:Uncharacterized protein n=1 Tax=Chlamydomonas schloesseri TaxID=2026947 RepID=A0A835T536_9CHLO|nr:hypothetical protein HYH02_006612 [Chlamydomonas schloesseri]|eukprot:KAG2439087.1 hypothetical protein HYH02_006612 [Chlamydomonas schloesseri]
MCGRGLRPLQLMLRFRSGAESSWGLSPAARRAYALAVLRALTPSDAAPVSSVLRGSVPGGGPSGSCNAVLAAPKGLSGHASLPDGGGAVAGGGLNGGCLSSGGGGASIRKLRLEGVPLEGSAAVAAEDAVLQALDTALPGLTALKLYGYELGESSCGGITRRSCSGSGSGSNSTDEASSGREACQGVRRGGGGGRGGVSSLLQLLGSRLREVTFQDCRAPAAAVAAAPAPAVAAPGPAVAEAATAAQAEASWDATLLAALRGCSSLRYLGLRSATACCPLLHRLLLLQPASQQPGPDLDPMNASAGRTPAPASAAKLGGDSKGSSSSSSSSRDADYWAVLGRLTALKLQSPLEPPTGTSLAPKPYPLNDSAHGWRDAPDATASARVASLCAVLQRLSGLTRLQLGERMEEFTSLAPLMLLPPPLQQLKPLQSLQQQQHSGAAGVAVLSSSSNTAELLLQPPPLSGLLLLQQLCELDVCSAAVSSGGELAALAALTALTRLSLSAITVASQQQQQLLQLLQITDAAAAWAPAGAVAAVDGGGLGWGASAAGGGMAYMAPSPPSAVLPPPPTAMRYPLPPRLVELAVAEPLSPWALLALQPPPCLAVLRVTGFVLDTWDAESSSSTQPAVAGAGAAAVQSSVARHCQQQQGQQQQLLPEWAERMMPASAMALAAALAALQGGRFAYRDLGIELHIGFSGPRRGRRRYLLPPLDGSSSSRVGSCTNSGRGGDGGAERVCGHGGLWLRQLAGVSGGRLQGLELAGLVLAAADVRLVVAGLPYLQDLRLDCRYPPSALPALAGLRWLQRLLLNASFWDELELQQLDVSGSSSGARGSSGRNARGQLRDQQQEQEREGLLGMPQEAEEEAEESLDEDVGEALRRLCVAAPGCLRDVSLTSAGRAAARHVAMGAVLKVEAGVARVHSGALRVWVAP